MRRLLILSLVLLLVILPILAQDEPEFGGTEGMKEEVRGGIIHTILDMFGGFTQFKIEGAQGSQGLFSSEFLAAFFIVYFLIGAASGFQVTEGPAKFVGGGLPKILFSLFFTLILWNTLGGFRYERFLVLMIPPMLVYYILTSVLTNFALLTGSVVKLVAIGAATITFLFYSPQVVEYLDGRYSYGVIDTLAFGGTAFFLVYIFGLFLTKFTNQVVSPLKDDSVAQSRGLRRKLNQLPEEERNKIIETLDVINMMKGGG
jgi:hypothetical protein